jgi:hypothetical protein
VQQDDGEGARVPAHGAAGHRSARLRVARGRQGPPAEHVQARDFREFRERVGQARAEGEARNVAIIANADWKAAAWMLERQHADRWGRPGVRPAGAPVDADAEPAGAGAGNVTPLDAIRRRPRGG